MSKLLINETPLQFLPTLALALGGERLAIALQQLHYMLMTPRMSETHKGRMWVRASYAQWRDEFFPCWSEQAIRRIFTELRELGVVIYEQHELPKGDATGFMSINYEALESLPHVSLSDTCHVSDSVIDHVSETDTSSISKKKGKEKEKKKTPSATAPRSRRSSAPKIEIAQTHPITEDMLTHPAIVAHRELIGVLLDGFAMKTIIETVGDAEDRWRAVLKDYRLHVSWRHDNIAAQLDKFINWTDQAQRSPANGNGAKNGAKTGVAESWLNAAAMAGMNVEGASHGI